MTEVDTTRAKILSELIQNARLRSGRSVIDCAQALGLSMEEFSDVESGDYILALPDLEVLAMYLKVPIDYFSGKKSVMEEHEPDYSSYMNLRQRIIGALLQQARIEANLSLEEVASQIDVDQTRLTAYEMGDEPIPYFELEALARLFEVGLDHFSDDEHGPLAKHETEQKMWRTFQELPPDVKAFVAEPINVSYMQTAMRLSEMGVEQLRGIAESILEITY
jgi:transcriptional regulator with XRE-family HTH domain